MSGVMRTHGCCFCGSCGRAAGASAAAIIHCLRLSAIGPKMVSGSRRQPDCRCYVHAGKENRRTGTQGGPGRQGADHAGRRIREGRDRARPGGQTRERAQRSRRLRSGYRRRAAPGYRLHPRKRGAHPRQPASRRNAMSKRGNPAASRRRRRSVRRPQPKRSSASRAARPLSRRFRSRQSRRQSSERARAGKPLSSPPSAVRRRPRGTRCCVGAGLLERLRAVPQAGAAVDAFLAVECGHAALRPA